MTELELIVDLHLATDRQGPGSNADTLNALQFIPNSQNLETVADLGCGTGGQTLTLAKHLNAQITAVDLFPEFLNQLNTRAYQEGVANQITTLQQSIDELPFKEDLDLIWSEGAIYNLGFKKGIQIWKDYLKPGGYLAVSEITWITSSRPKVIEDFWNNAYPEISQAKNKIADLEESGYNLMGYFKLSTESWLKTYYEPLEITISAFLDRHKNSDLAKKVAQEQLDEIALFKKYSKYFSYGFYIAQKGV